MIKTHRTAFIFLIISIIVSCTLHSEFLFQYMQAEPKPRYNWGFLSFPSNIYFFVMGIYAYIFTKFYYNHIKIYTVFLPILAILIIGGLLFLNLGRFVHNSYGFDKVLWGFGLTALCAWQARQPSFLIANKILEYFGERSYSIYLLHPLVIFFTKGKMLKVYDFFASSIGSYSYFLCAGIVIICILFVVEFTYRLIEIPGINLGRQLITRNNPV